jgi:hypothetical protein
MKVEAASMADVPVEVKLMILARLRMRSLVRMTYVSREFRILGRDPSLWTRSLPHRVTMSDAALAAYGQFITWYDGRRPSDPAWHSARLAALYEAGARIRHATVSADTLSHLLTSQALASLETLAVAGVDDQHRWHGSGTITGLVKCVVTVAPRLQRVKLLELHYLMHHNDCEDGYIVRINVNQRDATLIEYGARRRLATVGWAILYRRGHEPTCPVVIQRWTAFPSK